MKIREKIMLDRAGYEEHGPINIAIFGDSVSHACFNGYQDYERVYWNVLKSKLCAVRSYVPINTICAAVGGTSAKASLPRLDSQILKHEPDLLIVCFGLNDVNGELDSYLSSLKQIFERSLPVCGEVIFLTPNMLNTYVAEGTPKEYFDYAHKTANMQNGGRMDEFIYAAKALAESMGVLVCDCYSEWKRLSDRTDTTMLLSNRINHPTEEMHELFADKLFELIMGEGEKIGGDDDGMYKG